MRYLGINIYYWGSGEQQQLRKELRRWVAEAEERGLLQRFWYTSFDSRGPHLFALFATRQEDYSALESMLRQRAEAFLVSFPSLTELSLDELTIRHGECRGTVMNCVDRMDGIAANNTFEVFEHDDASFPFKITGKMERPELIWERIDLASRWTLDLATGNRARAALQWLRAIDRALTRKAVPSSLYWRFHAGTLMLRLEEFLEARGETVEQWLAKAVTQRNHAMFSEVWNSSGEIPVDSDALVSALLSTPGLELNERFRIMRDLDHTILLQLGQLVRLQIPMVLFAWQQSLQ